MVVHGLMYVNGTCGLRNIKVLSEGGAIGVHQTRLSIRSKLIAII